MTPPGPIPKPDEKRERRNAPTFETTELAGGKAKAPPLTGRSKLLPQTRRWWDTWVDSPQAAQFLSTDWGRLLKLVPMVDAYFAGELKWLGEIRQNESLLGATPMDRLRLRWRMREADKDAEREGSREAKKAAPRRRKDPRLDVIEGGRS